MIKTINGNMFDDECDLLIIPCNNEGDVGIGIFRECIRNKIRLPQEELNVGYGDVTFIKASNTRKVIGHIGYAVTVKANNNCASHDAFINIAEKIAKYALENKLKIINVPLLGGGAGGIDKVESFKILKSIFDREEYKELDFKIYYLQTSLKESLDLILNKPRVFISYTAKNHLNERWTLRLVDKLKENNIDARIDHYDLIPGRILTEWMTEEVKNADKVILIFDEHYLEKYNLKTRGGVAWEANIIKAEMLSMGNDNYKYIPIIVKEDIYNNLPMEIRNIYCISCCNRRMTDEKFNSLLRAICTKK